ncbi:hypothetical protein TrCOL_g13038 [Triparma columacea]|uniref:Uncharacterized protein n=1 Tax=Triparma columacea TaxID=722753 RepID=A0A9W7G9D9_9STRA|nr:hypothetical protein TrCOL_g13038 [Triparma columacea]
MGLCSSSAKVVVTNETSSASRYAIAGGGGGDNSDSGGGVMESPGGGGRGDNGFGLTNLADIKPGGDEGEDDGGDGRTFEVDDVNVDEGDTAEGKLREYKEELKKKGVGTKKRKSKNAGLVMNNNKPMEIEIKGGVIKNDGRGNDRFKGPMEIKVGHSLKDEGGDRIQVHDNQQFTQDDLDF